jgi:uncharacterized protein YjdB
MSQTLYESVAIISTLRVFLGAGLLLSCDGGYADISSPSRVASLVLKPLTATLELRETLQLTPVLRDSAGMILTDHPLTWTTSDAEVARVSPAGLVSPVAYGSVTITAVADGEFATASISVLAPVARVEITPEDPTIAVGTTVQLKATVHESGGPPRSGRVVAWSTSDPAVASVSVGKVGGRREGSAIIEATAGDIRATTTVTVTRSPAGPGTTTLRQQNPMASVR